MKRYQIIFLAFLLYIFLGFWGRAQVSRRHNVTVNVNALTYITINPASVTLSITDAQAVAGVDAMTVTNENSYLYWATNSSNRKVTVATDLGSPLYTLKIYAANVVSVDPSPGSAVAASELTLSRTVQDFILNIGRSMGYCTLRYTGTALASTGVGTDIHHITFTVTQ